MENDKRGGVGSWEMGDGRWEMGDGSLEMGVFRDWNLEFRKVFSELCAFFVLFVVKMLNSMTKVIVFSVQLGVKREKGKGKIRRWGSFDYYSFIPLSLLLRRPIYSNLYHLYG